MGNSIRLSLGGREIRLIGTAHISRESIEEVTAAIRGEKPGMVCVELDAGRYSSMEQQDAWEKLNVSRVLREGKGFLLIANIALSSFQRRLGSEIGVKPGGEMIAAVNAARELGIEFSLCDREVQATLRRAWARCGPWSKCKLLATLFSSVFAAEKLSSEEIENLKKSSELDGMMRELSDYLPAVKETLIDERDRYLAAKIWGAAGVGAGTIAVIGAGHLQGVRAWLEKFAGEESAGQRPDVGVAELESIPPRTLLSKCAKLIVPALIVGLLAVGFLRADGGRVLEMLFQWVLWNSGLAALGGILALAHPAAILAAALSAPFTIFFGPLLSAGILAGLVQATVRKPRVSDAESLSADIASLKGIYRNRITKALLAFLLANMGSALATWIAFGTMAGSLAR